MAVHVYLDLNGDSFSCTYDEIFCVPTMGMFCNVLWDNFTYCPSSCKSVITCLSLSITEKEKFEPDMPWLISPSSFKTTPFG
jgi:hypothetical protein